MMWRVLHALTATQWLMFLTFTLWDIVTHGNLPRTANAAGSFDTSTVLWILALFSLSAASAIRALWVEAA